LRIIEVVDELTLRGGVHSEVSLAFDVRWERHCSLVEPRGRHLPGFQLPSGLPDGCLTNQVLAGVPTKVNPDFADYLK